MQELNPKTLASYYSNVWSWSCYSNSKPTFFWSCVRLGFVNFQICVNSIVLESGRVVDNPCPNPDTRLRLGDFASITYVL